MSIESIQKVGSFQGAGNVVYQNLVGSPTTGDLWFDYSNVALKMYNGVEWTAFSNTTGDITGVTAGLGLSGGGLSGVVTLDLDFSELTNMTGDISGTTEFIIQDATTESRKAASGIKLSAFNNDSGWTDNDGTVTSIATSGTVNGLTLTGGPITDTGTITLGGTLSGIILTQLDPAAVILSSESFADINTAVLTAAATDDRILSYGYSTTTGTVTSIATSGTVNGITLTGGTITEDGTITLGGAINNLLLNQFDPAAVILGTESFLDTDTAVLTAAATDDRILSYGYSTTTGTVTSIGVSGGAGLTSTGGPITSSGTITLAVGAGTGLTVNADDIAITNTGVTAQQYGDAATIPVVTVNAQGQITLASELSIAIDASQITSGTIDTDRLTDVTLDNVTDNGSTTTNDITVGNLTSTGIDDNATSTAITIDANENVGIGGDPTSPLHVFGDAKLEEASPTLTLSDTSDGSTHLLQSVNTALNVQGAGQVRFTTAATERMRITNAGNVGIGETDPATRLEVKGSTGSGADSEIVRVTSTDSRSRIVLDNSIGKASLSSSGDTMEFRTGSVAGNADVVIDSTGNVGIGTSQPGAYNSNANDLVVGVSETGGNRGLTIASGTTSLGTIAFANGAAGNDLARQFIRADHNDGAMLFATGAGEKMRIDSTGNVGIGQTIPAYTIDARNVGGAFTAINIESPSDTTPSHLFFSDSANAVGRITYDHANDSMLFRVNSEQVMNIDSDGNVGIGASVPAANLHVKSDQDTKGNYLISRQEVFTPGDNHYLDTYVDNLANDVRFVSTGTNSGSFTFAGAPTGSEYMTIDSSGDLIMNGGAVQTTILTTGSSSTAGTMIGDWTLPAGSTFQATYADLAEKYTTDTEYESGTVMKFGGDAELTQSDTNNDHKVAGVLSTNPAYMLNAEIEGQYLALSGRVPVKVTGSVCPGDILVSSNVPGHAEVNNNARSGRIIGKAITNDANGVCEALVTLM